MSKRKYFLGFMLTLALVLGLGMAASEVQAGTGTTCGDGVVEQGEDCDDGNLVDCDGCDSNCTVSACGNNITCAAVVAPGDPNTPGETCDPPNGSTCDPQCQAVPLPLSKNQQKCVNAMNKDALQNVEKTQAKETEKCIKSYQKGKLVNPVNDCVGSDVKGKVAKKESKTTKNEGKFCTDAPPFAYTSAAVANAAGREGANQVVTAIFGSPLIGDPADPNNVLLTENQNKDTVKCQNDMLKRANKVDDTLVKEVNKAKKGAIKGTKTTAAVTTAGELQIALNQALTSPAKTDKQVGKLISSTDKKCQALVFPTNVFGSVNGGCGVGAANLGDVQDCVIASTICTVCKKFEVADNLDLDCDTADDGDPNNDSCDDI